MQIEPESYRCQAHDIDLTELVREAIEERVPVAYSRRTRSFEVIITCAGNGSPHSVVAAGRLVG